MNKLVEDKMNNKEEDRIKKPKIIQTEKGTVEYYLSEGDGPVILVSHGAPGGYDQAQITAEWIDKTKYRILCPSRPGFLGTPLENGKNIEEQADLFAALLDALKIDKASIVTVSAGGPPGYMFAIRHPDRVQSLIAICSVSGYFELTEQAGPISQALFLNGFGQKITMMIEEKRPDLFLKLLFKSEAYYTKAQIKEHVDYIMNSPDGIEFVNGFMATMFPYKPRKAGTDNDLAQYRQLTHLPLEKVQCPSFIAHGTHDADAKFHQGVYAYEHIPDCERFWIEEGSHLGFWLGPYAQEAQKAAREFLERKTEKFN